MKNLSQEKSSISVVIMTGNKLRHQYFANRLGKQFDLLGVLSEIHKPLPVSDGEGDDIIIREHSNERDKKEEHYFGENSDFNVSREKLLTVPNGSSNSPEAIAWVKKLNPDYLILYGTGIIREPLLDYFKDRTINMHLGLSPYYRGAATNFWPLVCGEPEGVGVTVHLAILKVDAGRILGQVRPKMDVGDRSHDIGCKAIIAGTELMARCVKDYHGGKIEPVSQTPGGKLFKIQDFNADAVRKMLDNFESGMIGDYLKESGHRNSKYPIISPHKL